jgi:SAM-dependent methyltransferase
MRESVDVPAAVELRWPTDVGETLDQDQEWCEVRFDEDGEWSRLRFHDYADIFRVPGLYEHLFYERLECCSPKVIAQLVREILAEDGQDAGTLRVLDVGAGNGMVAEALAALGTAGAIGVDILPEARDAALRDRPEVYDDYLVMDLTDPDPDDLQTLEAFAPTLLASVAALGFGDMPAAAFAQAFDVLADDGLVAFTIKDRFLEPGSGGGFSELMRELHDAGRFELLLEHRYRHRLSVAGEPLHYVACIGRKRAARRRG